MLCVSKSCTFIKCGGERVHLQGNLNWFSGYIGPFKISQREVIYVFQMTDAEHSNLSCNRVKQCYFFVLKLSFLFLVYV